VTVKPTVKLAAALLADSVSVLVPMVLAGLKTAVTPVGKPGTDKLTLLLKPFKGAIEIMLVPLDPWVIVTLLGEADRLKSGFVAVEEFTVRLNEAVWLKAPEVPVRVMGNVPVVAVLLAVSVSGPEPVTLVGLKVTPLGRPEADNAMVPVKPFCGVTVRVLVPVAPATTVAAVAERLKSGFATATAGVSVYIAV